MGREVEKYDFKAFGQVIKAARKAKGIQWLRFLESMKKSL